MQLEVLVTMQQQSTLPGEEQSSVVVIRAAVVQDVDRTLPLAELAKHLGCRNSVVVRIPSPVVSYYELHLLK